MNTIAFFMSLNILVMRDNTAPSRAIMEPWSVTVLDVTAMFEFLCAFWRSDYLLTLNTSLKRICIAHRQSPALVSFIYDRRVSFMLCSQQMLLQEFRHLCAHCKVVHHDHSPVNASGFQSSDAKINWYVDHTIYCENLRRPLLCWKSKPCVQV